MKYIQLGLVQIHPQGEKLWPYKYYPIMDLYMFLWYLIFLLCPEYMCSSRFHFWGIWTHFLDIPRFYWLRYLEEKKVYYYWLVLIYIRIHSPCVQLLQDGGGSVVIINIYGSRSIFLLFFSPRHWIWVMRNGN